MPTDARWLYALAGGIFTATVVHRLSKNTLPPGAPVSLMGDALAEHLRRPLGRILAEQKHPMLPGNIRSKWSTHDAVVAPPRGTAILLAIGLSSPGGQPGIGSSAFESLAGWVGSMSHAPGLPAQRVVVIVAPGSPYSLPVADAARRANAELLVLPGGACGPDGCTPSLATAGAWSVAVANHLLLAQWPFSSPLRQMARRACSLHDRSTCSPRESPCCSWQPWR